MNNRIALLTVVYENYFVLEDLFKTLKKQSNNNYHLYIADLSIDKKKIVEPDIDLTVITGKNKGYSHGINLCLNQAKKDKLTQFCVINNDILLAHNFIEELSKSFDLYPNSVFGGKIYYAPGYEYHKSRYGKSDLGKVLWYAGGSVDWKNVFINHRGVDEVDHGQYDKSEKTDFISGCLIAFDIQAINKIGNWDEDYFLYFEDADFCERAKREGISLYYNPSLIIWHKNAQSTDGSGSKIHSFYQEKNRVHFGLIYAPIKTKVYLIINLLKARIAAVLSSKKG